MRGLAFLLPIAFAVTASAQSEGSASDIADMSVCEYVAQEAAIANMQYLANRENSPFREDFTLQNGYLDIDGDGQPERFDPEVGGNQSGPSFAHGRVNGERGPDAAEQVTGEDLTLEESVLFSVLSDQYTRWRGRGFAWLPFGERVYGVYSPRFGLWQPRIIEDYSRDEGGAVCVLDAKTSFSSAVHWGDGISRLEAESRPSQLDPEALCNSVSSQSWDAAASGQIADDALQPTDKLTPADIAHLFEILERRTSPEQAARMKALYDERGEEEGPVFGDDLGSLSHNGPNVLKIDWDNDGDIDRLTFLRIDAASASGCSSSYWELLPDAQTGQVDADERGRLLDLQSVARDGEKHRRYPICWQRNSNWRVVGDRAYLESVKTRSPRTQTVLTFIEGKAEPVCSAAISLSFDVIFDRHRDIWPDDVRETAAIIMKEIQEQSNQETLPE